MTEEPGPFKMVVDRKGYRSRHAKGDTVALLLDCGHVITRKQSQGGYTIQYGKCDTCLRGWGIETSAKTPAEQWGFDSTLVPENFRRANTP